MRESIAVCPYLLFMLLDQQVRSPRKHCFISHLKSTAYRIKSLLNENIGHKTRGSMRGVPVLFFLYQLLVVARNCTGSKLSILPSGVLVLAGGQFCWALSEFLDFSRDSSVFPTSSHQYTPLFNPPLHSMSFDELMHLMSYFTLFTVRKNILV